MSMIKVILWDIDGTLLDFQEAEKDAIKSCFKKFKMGECSDEMIARYSAVNDRYWKLIEKKEISKKTALVKRFKEFFASEGLDVSVSEIFNEEYQIRLGDKIVFCDNAYELVKELKDQVKQYAVTNGTLTAQSKKLERSGLGHIFIKAFISDEIGFEKPSKEFFDVVLKEIGNYKKEEILIIGDSLTGDIAGGNNAGIKTCWYNPKRKVNDYNISADYEICTLQEVKSIISL